MPREWDETIGGTGLRGKWGKQNSHLNEEGDKTIKERG